MQNITIVLRDAEFTADITDGDALFFMTLFLNEAERGLLKRRGREVAFAAMRSRLEARLEKVPATEKKKHRDQIDTEVAEFVFSRINDEGTMRNEVAQRLTEIFPNIPESQIFYAEWRDEQGNTHHRGRIRLDAQEIMEVIAPIIATITNQIPDDISAKDAIVDVKNKGFEKPTQDKAARIERLRKQLAAVEQSEE